MDQNDAPRLASWGICLRRDWPSRWRLQSHLMVLVLAALLPLVLFAAVLLLMAAREERRTTERGMRDTVRALALAMDREVGEAYAALGVLTLSRPLAAGDLAGFAQQCLEALRLLPPDAWLTLRDVEGQWLLDTRMPYGTPLPGQAAPDVVRRIAATGRPDNSDLAVDAVTRQPVVTLDVPIMRDDRVHAVLSLTRPAATLGRLLNEQRLPAGWIAALDDRQHHILTRSHEPERFIGALATPRMAELSAAADEGWFPNISKDGTPIYTAFSRVQSTGWTMVLFAPAAVVDAPGRRSLWLLVSGGLALSALALGLAARLGRRLAAPMQALVTATQALAQGRPVALARAGTVREVQEVGAALHDAAALLQQREAALYEQRERLHITLASIGDAVIATDNQGRVTFVNPVATALAGWSEAEALGQDITTVFRIVNEHTRQAVENPVTRVLRQGTVVGLANHTLLITRSGAEHPIDDSGAPIRDAQGRLMGVVLVFRDVTERRRAEETRTRLAAIVESSDDAIIGKTLEGIITSWNHGAERMYGYTAEEVLGRSLIPLMPPGRPDELPAILARLARGEAIQHYETERVRKDGRVIPVSLTISPIRNPDGTIIGASTIARDITARQQAEAEVERRRRETALLAALAQSLSASLDLDTVLQRVVSGAHELCGSERVFLALREPGSDILVGSYEAGTPHVGYTGLRIEPGTGLGGLVLRTGRPYRTEDYATDPHFSKEYVERARAAGRLAVLAVPVLIGGQVEGVLFASNTTVHPFTDRDEAILVRLAAHAAVAIHNAQLYQQAQTEIAERRKAEAALAQAAAELEQRVEERTIALRHAMEERQRLAHEAQRAEHFAMLGRLAAGVSHEIRNPLGAVFLHTELLEEELRAPSPDSPVVIPETLAEIKTNLARLEDLVQDYLSLVRVGRIQPEVQDLGAAVATWGAEMQQEVAARGVTLQMQGLTALGRVAFDASMLRRALLNLVQNAADAMPKGGTITLAGQGTSEQVHLQLRDTGHGIPAAHLRQIFEPLYTTKPGGTGLGLYIVQEIVTAHDGQIGVQSVEGQGTVFTITLPRRAAPPLAHP